MKRFICILAVLSLLVGLMGTVSTTAFAASQIDAVELTVAQPQIGGDIAAAVATVPAGAGYTATTYWYDQSVWSTVTEGTFQDGWRYNLSVIVTALEGYTLSESTPVYLNGEAVSGNFDAEAQTLYVWKEYPLFSNPRTVELTLTEPVLGGNVADATVSCADTDIEVYAAWYTGDDPWAEDSQRLEDGQFTAGTYSLYIDILGGPPMDLNNLTCVTINGEEAENWSTCDDLYNTFWVIYNYTLEAPDEPIDVVELTMTEPKVGGSIADSTLTAPQDAAYTVSYSWFDMTDNTTATGTFQEGHSYMIIMGVYPKEGYCMTESTRVYVNGQDSFYYYLELYSMTIEGNCFFTVTSIIPGDFNGDELLSDADAIHLLRHTLFGDLYPITLDGDVNSDGSIDDRDAIYLLRHTLFPDTYPLYPTA